MANAQRQYGSVEEEKKKKLGGFKPRSLVILGLAVVAAGALTALALTGGGLGDSEQPAAVATTPGPWEYDPVQDRHWHADHGHWHPGPPPSVQGDGVEPPPYITNPTPWQYDQATDRHFDPGHGHWHAGPPPEGVDENTLVSPVKSDRVDPPPNIPNPTPWQYDAATDKHYHTPHGHWHSGPPPAPGNR